MNRLRVGYHYKTCSLSLSILGSLDPPVKRRRTVVSRPCHPPALGREVWNESAQTERREGTGRITAERLWKWGLLWKSSSASHIVVSCSSCSSFLPTLALPLSLSPSPHRNNQSLVSVLLCCHMFIRIQDPNLSAPSLRNLHSKTCWRRKGLHRSDRILHSLWKTRDGGKVRRVVWNESHSERGNENRCPRFTAQKRQNKQQVFDVDITVRPDHTGRSALRFQEAAFQTSTSQTKNLRVGWVCTFKISSRWARQPGQSVQERYFSWHNKTFRHVWYVVVTAKNRSVFLGWTHTSLEILQCHKGSLVLLVSRHTSSNRRHFLFLILIFLDQQLS